VISYTLFAYFAGSPVETEAPQTGKSEPVLKATEAQVAPNSASGLDALLPMNDHTESHKLFGNESVTPTTQRHVPRDKARMKIAPADQYMVITIGVSMDADDTEMETLSRPDELAIIERGMPLDVGTPPNQWGNELAIEIRHGETVEESGGYPVAEFQEVIYIGQPRLLEP